ncbi:hypothetical protein GCM10025867_08150 [Frondihabitans sucicola]|uniref:Uncharacterized protein n=1 Tax=Frondihabitans sucicola TaxID=1268041 RepID=A0ABN6XUF7_9MICO|nr:hypothetical protein GCM10025867_08150 [Frondihabitans sucicola]
MTCEILATKFAAVHKVIPCFSNCAAKPCILASGIDNPNLDYGQSGFRLMHIWFRWRLRSDEDSHFGLAREHRLNKAIQRRYDVVITNFDRYGVKGLCSVDPD